MTTSGTIGFTLNRNQIITKALQKIGIVAAGETPTAEDMTNGSDALNMMVASWATQGVRLWAEDDAVLYVQDGVAKYELSSTGARATTQDRSTTLSADAASAATTVSVTSVASISSADSVGIEMDDDTLHWSTVSAISGTTLTLTSALDDTASSGAAVYSFTNKITRPLRVVEAYRRDADGNDVQMIPISRQEYNNLATKTSEGAPNQYYFETRLNTSYVYLWPTPSNDVDYRIHLVIRRSLDDYTAASNTSDFPKEWLEPLIFNLAWRLCSDYGVTVDQDLRAMAMQLKQQADGFDAEYTSVQIQPDSRW